MHGFHEAMMYRERLLDSPSARYSSKEPTERLKKWYTFGKSSLPYSFAGRDALCSGRRPGGIETTGSRDKVRNTL
jgi:hypothetical protein